MNDIDRSVESFDFAMRRRFRFIEIDADSNLEMLDQLNEKNLNHADQAKNTLQWLKTSIEGEANLGRNYQVGPSYFLHIKEDGCSFDDLWDEYISPLLESYLTGIYERDDILENLRKAYFGQQNDSYENT
jgi:hypothetical protein